MIYVIYVLICISIFFALTGVIGLLRMPDTYSRMQASTNCTTMGVIGVLLGAILYSAIYLGEASMAIKLAVLLVFIIASTPISSHALAKGAYKHGVRPEKDMEVDKLGEDMENG